MVLRARTRIENRHLQCLAATECHVQPMDGIRDTFFPGQAEQRILYFTIAGFSPVGRNSYKLSLNAHPPTPMTFQRVIVGFVRLFYRKPLRGQSCCKKLEGFLFLQLFPHSSRVQEKSGAHILQEDWGGPLNKFSPVVSS